MDGTVHGGTQSPGSTSERRRDTLRPVQHLPTRHQRQRSLIRGTNPASLQALSCSSISVDNPLWARTDLEPLIRALLLCCDVDRDTIRGTPIRVGYHA
jgi:hypothetical protein